MTIITQAAISDIRNRSHHIVGEILEDIGDAIATLAEDSPDIYTIGTDGHVDASDDDYMAYFEYDSSVFEVLYNRNREHIHTFTQLEDWEERLQAIFIVVKDNLPDIPCDDPTYVFNNDLWEDIKEFTKLEYTIHDPESGHDLATDIPVGMIIRALTPQTIIDLSHDDMVDLLTIQQALIYAVDDMIVNIVDSTPVALQHL